MSSSRYVSYASHNKPTITDLPAHWRVLRGRHLVTVQTGSGDTADADENGDYPFYVRSDSPLRSSGWEFDTKAVLTAGDGAGVAKVFHLVSGKFMAHQRVYVLHNFRQVTPEFFFYAFKSLFHLMALDGSAKSTVDSVRRNMITDMPIGIPPFDEQRAIVDYLDQETAQIDALVAKQEEFIGLLRERRRAAIEHVFAKIEAVRAALRHFSVLVAGSGFPVELQGRADLELPFFKVGNLKSVDRDGVLVRSEHTIARSTARALSATVIPKGSLVFAKVGAALLLGRVAPLPDDGCIDNNMSALIFDESIDLKFARYLMLTFEFREFVLPGPVPSLDMDGLREFKVPVLSVEQQRAIADSLDEETSRIDTLIAKAEEHIAFAKERREALVTAAVTGQLDVRTSRKAG